MNGFLFTLCATFLAGIGARDQRIVAQLTLAQGRRIGLLAVAIGCGALAAGAAAWAAENLAPQFDPALSDASPQVAHTARLLLACFALAAAGGESLFAGHARKAEEPTHSLGAAAIVILAHQITDACRFVTFAIAVAAPPALTAGIGGALGGGAALALGWRRAARFAQPSAASRRGRRGAGVVLLGVAGLLAVWTLWVAGRIGG